jgi:hypothetical protein
VQAYANDWGYWFSPFAHPPGSNDALQFYDPETLAPISTVQPLATWTTSGNNYSVTLSPAIPELAPYVGLPSAQLPVIQEPQLSSPNFVIQNICSHDDHGRILAEGGNGLIENSVFANSYFGPIDIYTMPTMAADASVPGNIIVRDNKIIGTGYGGSGEGTAILVEGSGSTGFEADGYPIRSLQINDNFISNTPGLGIMILAARDVQVRGNTIVDANTVPFDPDDALYCANPQPVQPYGAGQPWCPAKVAPNGSIMAAWDMNVSLSNNTFLGTSQGLFVDPASTVGITTQ